MCLYEYDDDPEPEEPVPAGPLYVPVRPGGVGVAVRMFRTPLGTHTAVAFTSRERLAATLGTDQPWVRLSGPVLRAMTRPLGMRLLTVDPTFTAAQVAAAPAASRTSSPDGRRAARTA
ncbi:SAV_915 family protein [Streptomyces pinistramenti]|uniref:SAV_915 family protein n=1 Tax=Streptomyces pinistramenti TaxID=2884812 RepID=UPI001D092802|nr:SAV_915 family protein [Streptomyces pinistramenti]MCB5907878.1 SseB family protein [Streptomyces pinistramenti]